MMDYAKSNYIPEDKCQPVEKKSGETQGVLAAGDDYNQKYEQSLGNFEKKTKSMDGTALWDTDVRELTV
jgi:hypothetical protein